MIPNLRVSNSNSPFKLHGIVAEYDAKPGGDPKDSIKKNSPAHLRPTFIVKSFSGNYRLIWLFEEPVFWFSDDLALAFQKIFLREVKARKLLPGFELDESIRVGQYWEVGTDWSNIEGAQPVPSALTQAWLAKASEKINWKRHGEQIPISKIREEAEKRWPGRWPGGWGNFTLGARGVRFWEPEADALAVIVRETGVQCFTGDKPFVTWADIFGSGWCHQTTDTILGAAIESFYFDPGANKYWYKNPISGWQQMSKPDVMMHLRRWAFLNNKKGR